MFTSSVASEQITRHNKHPDMADQQIERIVQSPESWLRPFHGESRELERFKDDIRTALAAADLPDIAYRVRLVTRHLSSSIRDSIEFYPAEERRIPDEILQLLSKIYGEHMRLSCAPLT